VTRAVLAALLAGVLAAGCGGEGARADEEPTRVFAAASLTEVFRALDAAPRYHFTGSDELATQIREGAGFDVFAAASAAHPNELHAEGLVERPRVFATNRLVLIVPETNPSGITDVLDLRTRAARLVVGDAGVPVGDYTRRALDALGAPEILDRVVSEERDVKGVVGKVALGEADAGFVYATDVAPVADRVRVIELPAEGMPQIEYLIAVAAGSPRREAAEIFVERVLGGEGRAALEDAGFGLP
jgi:molybdate transport system substrate-binding protein